MGIDGHGHINKSGEKNHGDLPGIQRVSKLIEPIIWVGIYFWFNEQEWGTVPFYHAMFMACEYSTWLAYSLNVS